MNKTYVNIICFICALVQGIVLVADQTLFRVVCNYLNVDNTTMWIGFFSSAFFIGMVVVAIISGEIAERIGKKNVITLFCFVIVAGTLVLSFCTSPVAGLIGFVLIGLGFGAVEGMENALLVDVNSDSASILNYNSVFFSAGAILSPLLISGFLENGGDWHFVYIVIIVLFVVLGILFAAAKVEKTVSAKQVQVPKMVSVKLLKNKYFLLSCILIFIYLGAESGATSWTSHIFDSTSFGAWALAIFWAAMGISRFIMARFCSKRTHTALSVFAALGIAGFAGIIFLHDNAAASLVLFFLIGFGLGPHWPSYFSLGTDASGKYTGAAGGVIMFFSSLGGAVLSLVTGSFSGFQIMIVCAVYMAAVLAVQRVFAHQKKRELLKQNTEQ